MAIILLTKIKRTIHSIRWKIVFAYLLIITVAFSAVAVSLIQLVGEYLFTQRIRDDQRIAETLSEQIGDSLVALDIDSMLTLARGTADENAGRVLVVDLYGVVQADTASLITGTRFPNREVYNVLLGADDDYGFYDAGESGNFWMQSALSFYENVRSMNGLYAHGVYQDGALVGAVAYISAVQEIYENLHSIQLKILSWMIVVAALVLIMSLFVTRGFIYVKESEDLMTELEGVVVAAAEGVLSKRRYDVGELRGAVKNAASNYLFKTTKRSPMIIPVVTKFD